MAGQTPRYNLRRSIRPRSKPETPEVAPKSALILLKSLEALRSAQRRLGHSQRSEESRFGFQDTARCFAAMKMTARRIHLAPPLALTRCPLPQQPYRPALAPAAARSVAAPGAEGPVDFVARAREPSSARANSSAGRPRVISTLSPARTSSNNSSASRVRIRMQPCDAACPIDSGAFVPCIP